jgi:hypothetical protein
MVGEKIDLKTVVLSRSSASPYTNANIRKLLPTCMLITDYRETIAG